MSIQDQAGATLNGFTVGDKVKVTKLYATTDEPPVSTTAKRWEGYDTVTLIAVDPDDEYYPYEVERKDDGPGLVNAWAHAIEHITVTVDQFAVGSKHSDGEGTHTVEAVHADNSGNHPDGDLIVLRGDDGTVWGTDRRWASGNTTPWEEPTPPVWEANHRYQIRGSRVTVTAVDDNGNALIEWESGGFGAILASQRNSDAITDVTDAEV